ncbi:MAG: phosphatase PAP2 family protein [Propionicimonas sp.]|nr:phosphatase PAP2 family protein [Propionicimonas sp.]
MNEVKPLWARRRGQVILGAAAILLAGVIGLLVVRGHPAIDERWMTAAIAARGPGWDVVALTLNYLGGGLIGAVVVPILVTLALARWRGWWQAAYFLVASAASALVVQVLKAVFDRARPEDMLVVSDPGSFPSGHTANAATIAVAMGLLFPRWWVWLAGAGYTVLMAVSRTYLGAHWLTDTLGGMLVGAGVAVLVWAAFGDRLADSGQQPADDPGVAGQE